MLTCLAGDLASDHVSLRVSALQLHLPFLGESVGRNVQDGDKTALQKLTSLSVRLWHKVCTRLFTHLPDLSRLKRLCQYSSYCFEMSSLINLQGMDFHLILNFA